VHKQLKKLEKRTGRSECAVRGRNRKIVPAIETVVHAQLAMPEALQRAELSMSAWHRYKAASQQLSRNSRRSAIIDRPGRLSSQECLSRKLSAGHGWLEDIDKRTIGFSATNCKNSKHVSTAQRFAKDLIEYARSPACISFMVLIVCFV
jgi:hypothetical protein